MALTDEQIPALRAAINAETDPAFVAFRTSGATGAMAEFFNTLSTFTVWKTFISEHEITGNVSAENTTWSWTTYIGRSEQERNGWARMFNGTYSINPSLPQVRLGIEDIFSGSGSVPTAQRAHIYAIGKRKAKKGERLYATGTGTVVTPGLLVFEGNIENYDVVRAIN